MKLKTIPFLLFFVLIFSVISCRKDDDNTSPKSEEKNETSATMTQHQFASTENGTIGYWLYSSINIAEN